MTYGEATYGETGYGEAEAEAVPEISPAWIQATPTTKEADKWAPAAFTAPTPTYSQIILADSPLAYYRLDETSGTTLLDVSTNALNGTYTGAVVLNQPSLLPAGNNPSVDFAGGYAQVTDNALLRTANISVECWFVADALNSDRPLVTRTDWGTGNGDAARSWHLMVKNSALGAQINANGNVETFTAATLVTGQLYHAVLTYNGSLMKVYLNGTQVISSSVPSGGALHPSTGVPLAIGTDSVRKYAKFDGRIDEVAIYGTALSAGQIATHYAAGLEDTGVSVTLGQATETDTARPLNVVLGLGRAVETDTAFTIINPVSKVVGQATETDTANPVVAVLTRTVSVERADETDAAQPFAIIVPRTFTVGQATSTETAQPVALDQGPPPPPVVVSGSPAQESDTVYTGTFSVAPPATIHIAGGTATESDSAYVGALTIEGAPPVLVAGGTATEADTAPAGTLSIVTPPVLIAGTTAQETQTATAGTVYIAPPPNVMLAGGVAEETDQARVGALIAPPPPSAILIDGGIASETDAAVAGALATNFTVSEYTVEALTSAAPFGENLRVTEASVEILSPAPSAPGITLSENIVEVLHDTTEPPLVVSEHIVEALSKAPGTATTSSSIFFTADTDVVPTGGLDYFAANAVLPLGSSNTIKPRVYKDFIEEDAPLHWINYNVWPLVDTGSSPTPISTQSISSGMLGAPLVHGADPTDKALHIAPQTGVYGFVYTGSIDIPSQFAIEFVFKYDEIPTQNPTAGSDIVQWGGLRVYVTGAGRLIAYNDVGVDPDLDQDVFDGKVHTLTIIRRNANDIDYYVDGKVTATTTHTNLGSSGSLYAPYSQTSVAADEFQVYDNISAFTPERIEDRYQAAIGQFIDPNETHAVLPAFTAANTVYVPVSVDTDASLSFAATGEAVLDPDNSVLSHAIPWLDMPEGSLEFSLDGVDQRWYKFTVLDDGYMTMYADDPSIKITVYRTDVAEVLSEADLVYEWDSDETLLGYSNLFYPYADPSGVDTYYWYVKVENTDPAPTDFTHTLTWSRYSAAVDPEDPETYPEVPEPPYYDDRATPYDLGSDEYGSIVSLIPMALTSNETGSPTGSMGTAWLKWVAPFQTEFTGTFDFSEAFTLTVFVNGVQVEEHSGSTVEIDALSVPAEAVVEFRVATKTGGGSIDQITWGVAAEPEEPQNPSLFQYLRVEIYEPDGTTLITEVPRRLSPTFDTLLNEQGSGEVTLLMNDPIVQAYEDTLFNHRNIVKFFIEKKCVFAFRIRSRSTTWVSSEEYAGLVRTISGPSLENILDDAIVKHDRQPHDASLAQRVYSWASPRSTNVDAYNWYDPKDWDAPIVASKLDDPPGPFQGENPIPAKDRDKYNNPKDWPDKTAKWMFIYQDKHRNKKFGTTTKNFNAEEWRNRYYRHAFFLEEAKLIRFYATTDDSFTLYLDGEELIKQRNAETGYTSFNYVDVELEMGWHTIGAHVVARRPLVKAEDGTDAFLFTAMEIARNGKPLDVIFNSGNGGAWHAYYGEDPPGWNRAQILINFWNEARRRGHHIGDILELGFDGIEDSDGEEWADKKWNKEVAIGMKGTELVSLLAETGGFDVWVAPGPMKLMASKKRGKNRATSVKLEPGRNVLDWSIESVDEVENDFLVQYDGGWIEYDIDKSIEKYGVSEAFISLGEVKYRASARYIMRGLAKGLAWARTRSGSEDLKRKPANQPSGSVIAVHGAAPFFDYDVGDVVSAMLENGKYGPHRILAIAVSEDDTGALSYDLELEAVKDA